MPGGQLNLLSLDGGGVRGLSSLYVLQKLMEQINPDDPPKPCDYFDMIGGTSTGGLIAIMLGRLGMTVQECIDSYMTISDTVFVKKTSMPVSFRGRVQERYDSGKLAATVRKLLSGRGLDPEALLKTDTTSSCHVYVMDTKHHDGISVLNRFVCATSEGTSSPVLLTTYRNPRLSTELYNHTKIWEAARATSAASSYFDPIKIGPSKQKFLDGGTGANNPVRQLWLQAQQILAKNETLEDHLNCLVSIGTGVPSEQRFGEKVTEVAASMVRIATEAKETAEGFLQEHRSLHKGGRYYRFNADGVGDIGLDKAEDKDLIASRTDKYLRSELIWDNVENCGKRLNESERRVPLPPSNPFLAVLKRDERELRSGKPNDKLQSIFTNLSDYDHHRVCRQFTRKRCGSTTSWLLKHEMFRAWMESSTVGSGKSIATSTAIEEVDKHLQGSGTPIAHFYFRSSFPERLKAIHCLESAAKQFTGSVDRLPAQVMTDIEKFYTPGNERADPSELTSEVLLPLVKVRGTAVLFVDGLDECEPGERRLLVAQIKRLIECGTKVFIASRAEINLIQTIPGTTSIEISKENPDVQRDLKHFIKATIDEKTQERTITENNEVLELIRITLLRKAGAMFLWVKLLVDEMWENCHSDAAILKELETLPETLNGTYRRCVKRSFQRFDAKNAGTKSRFDGRVLRWVGAAIQPFRLEELREALVINPETGEPRDPTTRPNRDFVLRCGANLVVLDAETDHITLAHHSVKQYLFPNHSEEHSLEMSDWETILRTTEEAELEIGELCVMHLYWRSFSSIIPCGNQIRTPVPANLLRVSTPLKRLFGSRLAPPLVLPRPRPRETYHETFSSYASENWALHTRNIEGSSPYWKEWKEIALDTRATLHPWLPQGPGGYPQNLLGWAIVHSHVPFIHLLSEEPQIPKRIWDLPLTQNGSLLPLLLAANTGDRRVLDFMLGQCNTFYDEDFSGNNILHYLVQHRLVEVTKFLVHNGWSLAMQRNKEGFTPLDCAVLNNCLEIVSELVPQLHGFPWYPSNASRVLGNALRLAAKSALDAFVEPLIEAHLEWAVGPGGRSASVWTLIDADEHGRNALHYAVMGRHFTFAQRLVQWSVKVARTTDLRACLSDPLHDVRWRDWKKLAKKIQVEQFGPDLTDFATCGQGLLAIIDSADEDGRKAMDYADDATPSSLYELCSVLRKICEGEQDGWNMLEEEYPPDGESASSNR